MLERSRERIRLNFHNLSILLSKFCFDFSLKLLTQNYYNLRGDFKTNFSPVLYSLYFPTFTYNYYFVSHSFLN